MPHDTVARRDGGFNMTRMLLVVLMSMLMLGAVACDDRTLPGETTRTDAPEETTSASDEGVYPERNVITTFDPDFDASHRITLEVPEDYGDHGFAYLKGGLVETGVSVWVVDRVYAEGCKADESRLERSPDGSVDGLAALLESQDGFRVSTPTDVKVDGFSGTYMERTLPGRIDPIGCFSARFQAWMTRGNGNRYLQHRGQQDLLWILDVDGTPLVIDAPLDSESTHQERTEVLRIVDSIQIDPR